MKSCKLSGEDKKLILKIINKLNFDNVNINYLDNHQYSGKYWDEALKFNDFEKLENLRIEQLLYFLTYEKDFFIDILLDKIGYIFMINKSKNIFQIKFKLKKDCDDIKVYYNYVFSNINTEFPQLEIFYSKKFTNI